MDEEDGRVVVEEELIFEADDEEMAELNEEKVEEPKVVQEEVIEEEEMVPAQAQQPASGTNIDLEEGEVAEEKPRKKPSKTLKVHLPDLVKGIDQTEDFPMTTEEIEKLDKRAKRFNTTNPIKAAEVTKVYDSLGIPPEERERKIKGEYRLEYIQMHGIFSLSEDEIFNYFGDYSVSSVIDLEEETCIVKFENGLSALRAMLELSKPIGLPKKEERVVKHVLTGSDEPERKVITRDLKEDFDRMVHPDDIPITMPEGKWRLGKEHKKCDAILLRFPKRPDFMPAHYLSNDKYKPNIQVTEPPPEVLEKERELREKNKNFDKKNPWGEVAAEWASPKKGGPREYIMDINHMDHPPQRFAVGMRDWDNPENENESNPTKVYPPQNSRKRKIHDRMDFGARETDPTETYFSEGELSESETEEKKDDIQWEGKLKRPRMGMVADIEEAKKAKNMLSRVGLTTKSKKKASRPALVLKRKVDNAKFVVREEVVEELSSDEDDHYLQEVRNKDLRHQLTMKIENQPTRQTLKPTRKFADRFEKKDLSDLELDDGRDLSHIENMKIEIRRDTSSSEEEDNGMEVDSDEDKVQRRRREEPRRRKSSPEVDLRQRMRGTSRRNSGENTKLRRSASGDLQSGESRRRNGSGELRRSNSGGGGDLRERMSSARPEVRVKVEKEDRKESREEKKTKKSSSKKMEVEEEEEEGGEEDAKLLEERVKEIELLKKQERKLLEEKERRLKEMERKREEEKQRAKREKEKERERREKEKEKERERQKQKEKERQEKERQRAKEKLREKERSRRSRKRSETSEDDSSESDSSDSESSESESSETDSSSSSEDSSSSDSESSSSESESEPEQRRSKKSTKKSSSSKKAPPPPPTKKSDKKKSAKPTESSKSAKSSSGKDKETKESKSSKSSSKKEAPPKEEDQKKAVELRDKLKTYLKKAKDAKDKKDEKEKK